MPLYEYESREDGTTISLLRAMKDADAPVEDPDGRGRTFVRKQSVFAVAGSPANPGAGQAHVHRGPGCACGNPHGPCAR
jgi:hypothetical protein